jgi:predicted molibdopterin-dependent oxidoreductase YjgC
MAEPAKALRHSSEHRKTSPQDGAFNILVNGVETPAYPGETIAAALYAAGVRAWRTSRSGEARGLLCGMGVCYDCLVTVDGVPNVRACQMLVEPGMVVEMDNGMERAP